MGNCRYPRGRNKVTAQALRKGALIVYRNARGQSKTAEVRSIEADLDHALNRVTVHLRDTYDHIDFSLFLYEIVGHVH